MINKVSDAYKKNLFIMVVGPLLKIVEATVDLFIPLFMKAVIDLSQYDSPYDIPNPISKALAIFIRLFCDGSDISEAITGGVIIAVTGVIGFLITMVSQYLAAVAASNVGTEVRNALYDKVLHLSKNEREEISSAQLITLINSDSIQLERGVLLLVRLAARAPFTLTGALLLSYLLDWRFGLAFTVIIPLLIIVNYLVLRRSSKGYALIQKDLDSISSSTTEAVEGSRVIRASNSENQEYHKFISKSESYESRSIKVNKINALINPLTFAVTSIMLIAVIYLIKNDLFVDDNILLISTIIAEMNYLAQIFFVTVQLTLVSFDITKAYVSSKRIDRVLTLSPKIVSGNKVNNNVDGALIKFDHVYYSFTNDDNYFLKDLDFEIRKGETLGIIGGTGSGKSTIINLLERFVDASKGEIRYHNVPIKEYDIKALRNEVGLVNQKPILFNGSIIENMRMSNPEAIEEEIINVLKGSEAYEFVSKYEDNISHQITEGSTNLSGGQKQRLAIARALIKHPKILILDDSTSALDLLTDKKIRTYLSNLKDMTKIIISQRVATIQHADYILVVEGGEIVERGKHEELLKNSTIYKEIYQTQIKKE